MLPALHGDIMRLIYDKLPNHHARAAFRVSHKEASTFPPHPLDRRIAALEPLLCARQAHARASWAYDEEENRRETCVVVTLPISSCSSSVNNKARRQKHYILVYHGDGRTTRTIMTYSNAASSNAAPSNAASNSNCLGGGGVQ